jgi:hypothetical protein
MAGKRTSDGGRGESADHGSAIKVAIIGAVGALLAAIVGGLFLLFLAKATIPLAVGNNLSWPSQRFP